MGNSTSALNEKFAKVMSKRCSYMSSDYKALHALQDKDCELCALASKAIYDGEKYFSRVLRSALKEKGYEVRRENYFDGKLEDHHDSEVHQPMSTLIYGTDGQSSSPSTMLITFRGSAVVNDWGANADAVPIRSRLWNDELSNIHVHKGWDGEIWDRFSLTMGSKGKREDGQPTIPELLKQFNVEKVLFAGHSLGGALAQIATLAAMVKLPGIVGDGSSPPDVRAYVFASPMPFYFDKNKLNYEEEEVLQRFRNNVHNVVFSLDVVPRIPGNHSWIAPCLQDFNKLGDKLVDEEASIFQHIPSVKYIINSFVKPYMRKMVHAAEENCKTFEKYKHASTVLLFDFNDDSSIEAFSSFVVRRCTPEEFAALPYPSPDDTFKAALGVPAHSCLPHVVAKNSFDPLTLFLAPGFASVACRDEEVRHVLSEMTSNVQSRKIQEESCLRLANLSNKGDNNRVVISEKGGIDAIIDSMKSHACSVGVAEQGCAALYNLSSNNGNNQVVISEKGGIDHIIDAMKWHAGSVGVAEQGCAALANLSSNNGNNQVVINEKGGIDHIIDAMKRHAASVRVAEQGCRALYNLSYNNDNEDIISKKGGIDHIIDAMKRHAASVKVAEQGCTALAKLACNNDNEDIISEKGGIDSIIDAMKRHADSAAVVKMGCFVLYNLAYNNDANNKAAIREAGGIDVLKQAKKTHGRYYAKRALKKL